MNVSMNVDCTPEEARRLMGLPDLQPIHELYLDKLRGMVTDGITPETVERMFRLWAPMGEAGMTAWRQALEQMTGAARG